jgi:CRP/FNR family transcriptional regulator, cyclic AMP receptor protein
MGSDVSWQVQALGWLSAALVLASFSLKTMVSLRVVAIASNVAFFTYGWLADLLPIYVLHGILLPVNLFRLNQMRNLLDRVKSVSSGEFSMDMLVPFMTIRSLPAGAVLFQEGDQVDGLYLILKGRVHIRRVGVEIGPGELLGEMALFNKSHERTAGAHCVTDVQLGTLSVSKFWEVFAQDPAFGAFVLRTVVARNARRSVDQGDAVVAKG